VGLRPPACWDCGFEYHQGDRYPSLVVVVCFKVAVSAIAYHSSREFLPSVVKPR
jgi:hypothetical protein